MILSCINYLYYFSFLLIFHIQSIYTYQCLKCVTNVYNHAVTSADLSSPTYDDCNIVPAIHGCYIHIEWLPDGTSEVFYDIDPELSYNSILGIIERQVTLVTKKYSTRRLIGFSCRSNTTICNTIDALKSVMLSLIVPSDEQLQQLDRFITPIEAFNSSHCSKLSNMFLCPIPDLINCRQCTSAIQYSRYLDICSTCSADQVTSNYFNYRTKIPQETTARVDTIVIGCQGRNTCNSMQNINQIKRALTIELTSEKVFHSSATTKTSTVLILMSFFSLLCGCKDSF